MYKEKSNYDRFPETVIEGFDGQAYSGYAQITEAVNKLTAGRKRTVIALEIYPGVRVDELIGGVSGAYDVSFCAEDCMVSVSEYERMISPYMTEDRVFGVMNGMTLGDFYIGEKVRELSDAIESVKSGRVLVYGTGASLVTEGDILLYADLARWEIQTRFKAGMANFHSENQGAPFLSKFKRGYFLEWRIADKVKNGLFERIDLLIDTNVKDKPTAVSGEGLRAALDEISKRPFRLVPYFDPGVWGGQWMKSVCDLPKDKDNYAWSFDGVPEENSLYFRFGGVRIEVPAMDLVLYRPKNLLGERVYDRFGAEFPIRFDFLDTMEGQNLSLQVHPTTEYIKKTFGMKYTQDESYYMLDCGENACVYLGLKSGVSLDDMLNDLRIAQAGGPAFPAEKYVNKIPAKKHDHFLIPAGTVHCSGANSMVLEISATPYIFTFKLWDWARLGLDGLPRPIHIEHGSQVIQTCRDTEWIYGNLVNRVELLSEDSDGDKVERTGLHELEFIETVRNSFTKPVVHSTDGSVNVLNLVEGEEAEVFSPTGAFSPFTVHYAETFIIPASVGEYGIRQSGESIGKRIMTVKATVRKQTAGR